MAGRREQAAAETEAALKDAARRVFARKGYLNTKITDITAEAGRAAGSFYNHFASKEELLRALLSDIAAAGDESALAEGHLTDFSDPAAVRWHVAQYWSFYREHASTMRALTQAALVSDEFARTMAEFGTTQAADVADHLDGVTAAGLRLPTGVEESIALMYRLLDGYAQMWLGGPAPAGASAPTDDEAVETLTRFVYRGLTGRDY
ncbi:TetR/AcrR family transcriptional regulator [Tsukamurella sp. 8F]|uniref:TetR/AcrR family transcriptional regulator n=1 Tax=unclassified Tsukamurella TaxID=2633480 RepID=UPI0023B99482|nr:MULTISPECIES: TetR/AcrR family transcriptional regulator [unclassified Tsukamurella]MDF0532215.1 TetR/AcrR family transcriptional regulator [Tsukamurella sp. 8J]MDF0588080.1 TetR/AcrR family transcriptional regulator [Tsukamurella sp. 8F]